MAHQLFFEMPERNVMSWNSMIAAFSQSGRLNGVISLYEWVREHTIASGTAMTTAYARHGRIHEAMTFFEQIPKPNVVTWNAMLAGVMTVSAVMIAAANQSCQTAPRSLPCLRKFKIEKKFLAGEAYSVLSDANKRFLYDVETYNSDDDENRTKKIVMNGGRENDCINNFLQMV
ncbi:hypothetical protein AAC387_Pa06g3196 [Persea americana]